MAGRRAGVLRLHDGRRGRLGQLWEYRPRGRDRGELRLVYESASPEDLEQPDNLVVVPETGHVFLQEDADGPHVRGDHAAR